MDVATSRSNFLGTGGGKGMANIGPIIGIDLGTSFSSVGVWRNGKVEIIPNELGNSSTPSCVTFSGNRCLVGDAAKDQETINLRNTVINAKRFLGKRYSEIRSLQAGTTFFVYPESSNDQPKIEVEHQGKQTFSVEEISALILMKMKTIAEAYLKTEVKQAVISVPAHYTSSQRQATIDAARIAGLDVLRLISEPTAAALTYGLERNPRVNRLVLIYDFGGGSLDVSVVSITDGVDFKVKATAGNSKLGGEDITNCLVNHLAERFLTQHGKDISKNARAMAKLKSEAEKAKCVLSVDQEAMIEIDRILPNVDFHAKVCREDLEDACKELFDEFLKPIRMIEETWRMQKKKIKLDDIILVGGSSNIPFIQNMLKDFFKGKKVIIVRKNSVAHGATLLAAKLRGVQRFELQDVTSYKLSSDGKGLRMFGIFDKDTPIPTKIEVNREEFRLDANQILRVYEGPARQNTLGLFPISSDVVTFEVDENGIFSVSAISKKIVNKEAKFPEKQFDFMKSRAERIQEESTLEEKRLEARKELHNYTDRLKLDLIKKQSNSHLVAKVNEVLDWLAQHQNEKENVYREKIRELENSREMDNRNTVPSSSVQSSEKSVPKISPRSQGNGTDPGDPSRNKAAPGKAFQNQSSSTIGPSPVLSPPTVQSIPDINETSSQKPSQSTIQPPPPPPASKKPSFPSNPPAEQARVPSSKSNTHTTKPPWGDLMSEIGERLKKVNTGEDSNNSSNYNTAKEQRNHQEHKNQEEATKRTNEFHPCDYSVSTASSGNQGHEIPTATKRVEKKEENKPQCMPRTTKPPTSQEAPSEGKTTSQPESMTTSTAPPPPPPPPPMPGSNFAARSPRPVSQQFPKSKDSEQSSSQPSKKATRSQTMPINDDLLREIREGVKLRPVDNGAQPVGRTGITLLSVLKQTMEKRRDQVASSDSDDETMSSDGKEDIDSEWEA